MNTSLEGLSPFETQLFRDKHHKNYVIQNLKNAIFATERHLKHLKQDLKDIVSSVPTPPETEGTT